MNIEDFPIHGIEVCVQILHDSTGRERFSTNFVPIAHRNVPFDTDFCTLLFDRYSNIYIVYARVIALFPDEEIDS